ncbi:MAG: hypothetical protein BWX47_01273 [candidate division Hyd24-12 bacterium ADurb.Bin004]|nr:MAG: hypothetical protein BWX47_01273 [candidate division Hyd24-12 bacterium ADurb.Bin004]
MTTPDIAFPYSAVAPPVMIEASETAETGSTALKELSTGDLTGMPSRRKATSPALPPRTWRDPPLETIPGCLLMISSMSGTGMSLISDRSMTCIVDGTVSRMRFL